MLLSRKIGAVLRGSATPFQVLLATTLGGLLGFVPGFFLPGDLGGGFLQAPGLILLLVCTVLVVNANLAVFGLVTLVAKLLSYALLPVSYRIGVWLLDGPLQGLFRGLANGKVTAWFGLERYATAGGLVLGLGFGLAGGWFLNGSIRLVRTRMATVEAGSERYQAYAGKWWVRLLTWALLGKGKGKKTWQELATQKKFGLPVRLGGVLVAAIGLASLWVVQQWFSAPILTRNIQGGLQRLNGATVDLESASLDFGQGQLRLAGLAIADSRALDQDLLAADELVATLDTGELLRRRLVIDELRSTSARSGTPRRAPGVRVPREAPPPPEPEPPTGTKTAEDYLRDFETWKQRLEQAREWLEVLTGGEDAEPAPSTPEQHAADRAEQERRVGLARVVANHLLEAAPRVLIRRIDIEGIGYSIGGKGDRLDLRLRNVSDRPAVVEGALALRLESQSEAMRLSLQGRSSASPATAFEFNLRGLAVDDVFGRLRIGGAPPLRGGTMDLQIQGALRQARGQATTIDAPLQVALRDTVFALAGARETKVESLLLPIGLRGPLVQPAIALDDKVLQDALLAAGQRELASFVQAQAGKLLGGLPVDVSGLIDPTKPPAEQVEAARQRAEAEAKRLEEEAKQKAEAEARRLQEEAARKAAEEAKKRLPGGLKGILPGDKKGQ
ncbi:MAG: hypothetical protein KF830_08035 [Planctomycetes bacterium]|nr:hypothetical protein [Planctomycetota bacterium]